jgi:hypothetical protein
MALALRRPYRNDAATREAPARPARTRVAAARGAWAAGTLLLTIARAIRLITALGALVIVVAIILHLTSANFGNVIVRDINDVAKTLVGPFKSIFTIKNPKVSIGVNWGLAALVWLIVGGIIASLIARIAPRGVHPSEPVA